MVPALIVNNWPRPGLSESVRGTGYLGHFAGHRDWWIFAGQETGSMVIGRGDPISALRVILEERSANANGCGAIGYIAYEAGYHLVGLERPPISSGFDYALPDIQFHLFRRLMHERPPTASTYHTLLSGNSPRHPDWIVGPRVARSVRKGEYLEHVNQIKDHIAQGNIYQANYTQAFELGTLNSPWENYQRLVRFCPAPYNSCLSFPGFSHRGTAPPDTEFPQITILGASPERLLLKQGNRIETRPIKGTIARGCDLADEQTQRRRLLSSAKDRAELLMITDLERNDLGRVALPGSVHVAAVARVRPAPSVWHLESTVAAKVDDGVTWVDALKAVFPGGSITGTPKRRAVEILSGLERQPRGVYCGAYGWIDAKGDCDFAVAIRTAVQIGDRIRLNGGGGIVADSDPGAEYEESLIKIAPMLMAFQSVESTSPKDHQGREEPETIHA